MKCFHFTLLFESYHSGIETIQKRMMKITITKFESYHSGIETSNGISIKVKADVFESYHSGIETSNISFEMD